MNAKTPSLFPDQEPAAHKPSASEPAAPLAAPRCRWMAFDIEIENVFESAPGEDIDKYGPFDISVAAMATDTGEVKHWFEKDATGQPGGHLSPIKAREMLEYLRAAQRAGVRVCAWNGLSFDLRWLGHAAGDFALAGEVALELYDPMFQFVAQRGFPVALANVAEGLGIEMKKLMHGADAPKRWAAGEHQLVLDYVAGDCRITALVVERIEKQREIRWRTKKGTVSSEPMRTLLTVREAMKLPLPDTSWMSEPLKREKFHAWLKPLAPL